jgi:lipoyl synthase
MIDVAPAAAHKRLPPWLKRPGSYGAPVKALEKSLADAGLHTVCAEAKCPNRGECFLRGTATFLILGRVCSRSCAFCGVAHGTPQNIDKDEPRHVCEAVRRMGISHAVVTSVTRDDLADGGASHFAEVIRVLKQELPALTVEVLVPDFNGNREALACVCEAGPHVFNHNVETIERLYPVARPQANYRRSLEILEIAADHEVQLDVKSGVMVGLGEKEHEVLATLADIRETGCSLITIGQYLRPSHEQLPVAEFISPERFDFYRDRALAMGFTKVSSGPFIRSSYRAGEMVGKKLTVDS